MRMLSSRKPMLPCSRSSKWRISRSPCQALSGVEPMKASQVCCSSKSPVQNAQ